MDDHQLIRYNRHILLPQIDLIGQQNIIDSKIIIVGCGGLGCTAIPILAAAGVGELTLIDDDRVDLTNLQRQTYYTPKDIGEFKVDVLARFVQSQNPEVKVNAFKRRLTFTELSSLISHYDLILDCSDNLMTRQMINHVAVQQKIPLVFASATRFEGQLSVFDVNQAGSPCYACLFDGQDTGQDNCSFTGVFAPLVNVMGSLQATEALKVIAKIGHPTVGNLLHYNALSGSFYSVACDRNPACRICSH